MFAALLATFVSLQKLFVVGEEILRVAPEIVNADRNVVMGQFR
jgi:hypothetical protein